MTDERPKKPSDPGIIGIRLHHPTDQTKIIQLEMSNTGLLTSDNIEIWRLATGSGGGPSPALPIAILPNPPVSVTAVAAALPDKSLVNGAILKAPAANAGSVWVGGDATVAVNNGYELEPGEFVPVAAINLNKFFIIGTLGDVLQWIGG